MTGLGGYALRLDAAAAKASEALVKIGYSDRITGEPAYSVMTAIPGGADVQLTRDGKFVVVNPGRIPYIPSTAKKFSPAAFLNYVSKVAKKKGSTSPSILTLDDLLAHLVDEIEKVPQIAPILQEKGSSSDLKLLLA